MPNKFTIDIDGISFEFLTMNVNRAQLFQVYIEREGKKVRYHIKNDGKDNFIFALREEIPVDIVKHEEELSRQIRQLYNLS